MRRLTTLSLAAFAAGAIGCQRDDASIAEKLDQIDKRLASIEQKIAQGGVGAGRGGQQMPQRPRPNPGDTYAVPIAGSPSKGAQHAKVTIVEAFEFA
jgi:hypothetical protein